MLRPATPLSILLFIAFVLLLLSVISTPIVKAISLATFEGVDYGVFGFCKGAQCSGIEIGYTTREYPYAWRGRSKIPTGTGVMALEVGGKQVVVIRARIL